MIKYSQYVIIESDFKGAIFSNIESRKQPTL